ncbi:MAG TPA: tetratricopeptide repeat protein [Anaerolineae bacterium]|nr:tetratricopeptide repeat protein [Anaerolineae bacterium]
MLGKLQVWRGDEPVEKFVSAKARALLCYLALAEQPQSRHVLAGLLWGEDSDENAKLSLRVALSNLRQQLPDALIADRQTVAFNRELDYWLDVEAFEAGLRHEGPDRPETLEQVVELYRGEFLADLHVDGAPAFEEWLLVERERLGMLALGAMQQVAEERLSHGDPAHAVETYQRMLALDPLQESIHCKLMLALAHQGRYTAAMAQYQRCRQILEEELGVEPMPETTELAQRIQVARSRPQRHNLPLVHTPFIGREFEVQRLTRMLLDPEKQLITVVGPGGAGKTRLTLEVAATQVNAFLDGVVFVSLAPLDEPTGVAAAVALALDLPLSGQTDPQTQILNYLRQKELLLVLDNFEHLLEAVHFVVMILESAPSVKLLVTSRESLRIPWETRLPLAGLSYAADDGNENADAIQLFAQAAQRVVPGFNLRANLADVERICWLVEGLPLAIELAAAWIDTIPCADIAREISKDLNILSGTAPGLPERHRSLRATFEYSWRLLKPNEQQTLLKLSVFRGGFEREAVAEVTAASLNTLKALVEKSLLHLTASGRYELHELLRQVVGEKLVRLPDVLIPTYDKHCTYYTDLVHQQEERITTSGINQAIETIGHELENIRVAWRWAATHRKLEALNRSTVTMSRFYLLRGPLQEGEALFQVVSDSLWSVTPKGDTDKAAYLTLSKALLEQVRFCTEQGRYDRAIKLAIQAVGLAQAHQADDLTAEGYLQCGNAFWYQGNYLEARAEIQKSLTIAQANQLRIIEADSLRALGSVCWAMGEYVSASSYFGQALSIYRELVDEYGEGLTLDNLGLLLLELEDYHGARDYFERSLTIRRQIGDRQGEGFNLRNLGIVAQVLGEDEQSRAYNEESLHIYYKLGHRRGEAGALRNLGQNEAEVGQYARGRLYLESSLAAFREIGDQRGEIGTLSALGLLLHHLGENKSAEEICSRAIHLSEEIGNRFYRAFTLTYLGHILVAQGRGTKAAEVYQQALDERYGLGQVRLATEPLAGLANLYLLQDDLPRALTFVESILHHLRTRQLTGTREPFRIYLTCYQVLKAAGDPQADDLLKDAYRQLKERAARITEESLRHSFLENVAAHREIIKAFEVAAPNSGTYAPA